MPHDEYEQPYTTLSLVVQPGAVFRPRVRVFRVRVPSRNSACFFA